MFNVWHLTDKSHVHIPKLPYFASKVLLSIYKEGIVIPDWQEGLAIALIGDARLPASQTAVLILPSYFVLSTVWQDDWAPASPLLPFQQSCVHATRSLANVASSLHRIHICGSTLVMSILRTHLTVARSVQCPSTQSHAWTFLVNGWCGDNWLITDQLRARDHVSSGMAIERQRGMLPECYYIDAVWGCLLGPVCART